MASSKATAQRSVSNMERTCSAGQTPHDKASLSADPHPVCEVVLPARKDQGQQAAAAACDICGGAAGMVSQSRSR